MWQRYLQFFCGISSIILLALPFLPLPILIGSFPDEKGLFTPQEWALGAFITLSVAAIIPSAIGTFAAEKFNWLLSLEFYPQILFALIGATLCFIRYTAFSFAPLLVDETAQIFQAKIFAGGHLTAPLPKLPEFFLMQHVVVDGSRIYSQYPPGHSAALALGFILGMPWMVGPALTLLTVVFLYQFSSAAYGEVTARRVLLLSLFSPFLLFLGASYMNHISALCGLSLALWQTAAWEIKRAPRNLFWAGVGVGIAFLSRPLCAIGGGIVLAIWIAPQLLRRRDGLGLSFGAIGALLFLGLFFAYNTVTTGDPLLPGYIKLWGAEHGLGFHHTPWGGDHTPRNGFRNLLINVSMLEEYLLESPIPALIPMALLGLAGSTEKSRWDRRLVAFFWAFPVVYFLYWHRDSYLGPRFISVSMLAAIPLTVRGLEVLSAQLSEKKLFGYPLAPRLTAAIALSLSYILLLGFPNRFEIYRTGMASMKEARVFERTLPKNEKRLLFVPVSWGARMISILRVHGASAPVMEETYHLADHCALQQLTDEVLAGKITERDVDTRLRALQLDKAPLARLSPDTSLRLVPGRELTSRCVTEIEKDRQGFTVSLPYLTLNSPELTGPVIFATDLGERNGELEKLFPDYRAERVVSETTFH